jgi:hypothetical protein
MRYSMSVRDGHRQGLVDVRPFLAVDHRVADDVTSGSGPGFTTTNFMA